jgi:hypothetical protein
MTTARKRGCCIGASLHSRAVNTLENMEIHNSSERGIVVAELTDHA